MEELERLRKEVEDGKKETEAMRQREETSAGELEKLRREKSEVDKQCVSLRAELEETKRKLEKSETQTSCEPNAPEDWYLFSLRIT